MMIENYVESVRTIPIKIEKNPKFYKIIDDYIEKSTELLFRKKEKIESDDFYDRAVY